ncbi:hypothetical protein VCRA2122O12_350035 [Vibrio crassostreae]|nr:hypothetical protein EDB51_1084 [Vibrio crassostreae]CAK2006616.1 hypothetical protein VCRA2114E5_320003 [Vibrio crassostreae]CAK2008718.1 hypothetical protein VCRA2110O4_340003 [Vibrio crassostreae]CAK2018949.1 hypothetical protein VCRA2110O1_350035 [Vibrio crassostreae]CAK2801711.1 hypothetical protein VCRA2110O3_330036 [Vibrio crassostreae]
MPPFAPNCLSGNSGFSSAYSSSEAQFKDCRASIENYSAALAEFETCNNELMLTTLESYRKQTQDTYNCYVKQQVGAGNAETFDTGSCSKVKASPEDIPNFYAGFGGSNIELTQLIPDCVSDDGMNVNNSLKLSICKISVDNFLSLSHPQSAQTYYNTSSSAISFEMIEKQNATVESFNCRAQGRSDCYFMDF